MDEPAITMGSVQNQEVLISNKCGLSARIFSLLFSKEMSDVCLQVGAYRFELHKLILSASSDVFKAMLTNQKWPEAHRQPVVLIEEPQCESVFARFIEYIYSGELYLSHSSVCPLLTLADKYNVREMIPLCRAYMLDNLDAPIRESCVLQWLEMAHLRSDTELEAAIMDFVECNFGQVIQTPDFMAADVDTVVNLLSSSRLAVHNETMLLYAAMMWLETFIESSHLSEDSIKGVFHSVLCHLRWNMLTSDEIACLKDCPVLRQFLQKYRQYCLPKLFPSYIFQTYCVNDMKFLKTTPIQFKAEKLLPDPNIIKDSKKNLCLSKISSDHDESKKYHVHPKKTSNIQKRNSKEECLPRVYINDYWCTALTISNFHAFPQYGTQTFLFSTPSMSDSYSGHTMEWEVEMCPKGVFFPPAVLIGLERDGNKLVEERSLKTVRLSVMSHSQQELPFKVEVNVLIQTSSRAEPERTFIERCISHICIFHSRNQRHNLDNIVPIEQITNYLRPERSVPSLHLTCSMAFTLYIVIKKIPYAAVT
ncbi:BTB/POZ domain-containing protein 17-like [Elysia marginata]|uniref:BTB/POZ domain-containing protein 17-like n=1 Tax=Elysia marginata TaxID=1093978 RepID=A0AAV4HLR8_9GAST|nr:BTB/POZ domain-containing protein 17-like [Elysia marginata]